MDNPNSTLFAEIAIFLTPRVSCLDEVGHGWIAGDAEVWKDGRGAEGAGGLLAAVDAVAVEEHAGFGGGGCESDGATGA